jgi:hypothetical protein
MEASMDFERAKAITERCVESGASVILGQTYVDLPDCPLSDMLEATALIGASGPIENGDGTKTLLTTVDPRLLALHYAFEQYGKSPYALLEALGFRAVSTQSANV